MSLEIAPDAPPPDRCGTCRRCIDACPTAAIVPFGGRHAVDSRLCISYFTIELRGAIPEERRAGNGGHVFGCDICQDVCPWNRRAPVTGEPAFEPRHFAPPLERAGGAHRRGIPRAVRRHAGLARALRRFPAQRGHGHGQPRHCRSSAPALEKLAASEDPMVAEHARWALGKLVEARP